ncbi:MAG: prepilin peptidase, partial [Clostridia bacterium]|nr:prepilin peptidase [Clostridia bacterium]
MIFGFSLEFVIGLLASSFLVIVIVSDFNYLIISDEVTLFFSIVSILFQLVLGGWQLALSSVLFGAFLFFLMYFIMLLGNKIMQEEALGGGDVKLMFFVGTVLNVINPIELLTIKSYWCLTNGFFELFLSSCLALPFALASRCLKNGRVIP